MAVNIKKSNLSTQTLQMIYSMLRIVPDVPYKRFRRNNSEETIEPIYFYQEDNLSIDIPYILASSILQTIPNINNNFVKINLSFKGELRPNQLTVEAEAWEQLSTRGTSTLALDPGFGKTILGAKVTVKINLLTVVLVHREILTIQWKKTFTDFTDASVWIVGEKHPPSNCNVIICMDSRYELISKEIRDQVGLLIIDEAHAFCTRSHVQCLLSFHPKYILAESATLERDDNLHTMIYAICGTHGVYRECTKPFAAIKVITNTKPERKLTYFGETNWHHLVQTTLYNDRRNEIIKNIVINNPNNTIIILTRLVDHTMVLYELISKAGISCDYMCGLKKSYKDCRVLIGTMSKVGTGFDQATCCPDFSGRRFDLLLMVAWIKKYQELVQYVGRVFRADYPTIMHFVDDDSIYQSHWNKANAWYKKRGGVMSEVNIPNTEAPQVMGNVNEVQQKWLKSKK